MTSLDAFADALIDARRSGVRYTPHGPLPATVAEAYHVQRRVIAALGPVAGFKTAALAGHPPIMAPIRADGTTMSGATVAMGDTMGIELEVGWKIIAPIPAPARFDSDLARCILPVPVIELVDTRLDGAATDDPMAKLADNQINGGLVVGTPLADWDGRDFGTVTARMDAGDTRLLDGATGVPGGSALTTLRAFLAIVGDHCGGVQVGQVVITGTLHPLTYVTDPGAIRGRIDGLGSVSCDLVRPAKTNAG